MIRIDIGLTITRKKATIFSYDHSLKQHIQRVMLIFKRIELNTFFGQNKKIKEVKFFLLMRNHLLGWKREPSDDNLNSALSWLKISAVINRNHSRSTPCPTPISSWNLTQILVLSSSGDALRITIHESCNSLQRYRYFQMRFNIQTCNFKPFHIWMQLKQYKR